MKWTSGCTLMSTCKLIANVHITSVALGATWLNLPSVPTAHSQQDWNHDNRHTMCCNEQLQTQLPTLTPTASLLQLKCSRTSQVSGDVTAQQHVKRWDSVGLCWYKTILMTIFTSVKTCSVSDGEDEHVNSGSILLWLKLFSNVWCLFLFFAFLTV